jgi:hypothetical protein
MMNLKLPGYLQSAQVNYYQGHISRLLECPLNIIQLIMEATDENRQQLLSGEWQSPEELRQDYFDNLISQGQDYIRQKYYSEVI